jgi:co-chaperonin GroES (HSP10)
MKDVMAKMPAAMKEEEKKQGQDQLMEAMIKLAETTGNMRLDAITMGLSGEISNDNGFVVLIGHGKYDREAMTEAIESAAGEQVKVEKIEGMEVLSIEGEVNIILDRGERMIMVGGPAKQGAVLPVAEVVKALGNSEGGIKSEPDMVKLVNSVGVEGNVFAVMKVTETYKAGSPILEPFDTLVLTTKNVADGTEMKLVATGKDEKKSADAVKEFEDGRAEMLAQVDKAMEQMKGGEVPPEMKAMMDSVMPLIDMVRDIKTANDKGTVTVTAKMKGSFAGAVGTLPQVFFMMMSHRMMN